MILSRKRKHSRTVASTSEVDRRKRVQGGKDSNARRGPLFKYFKVVSKTPAANEVEIVTAREKKRVADRGRDGLGRRREERRGDSDVGKIDVKDLIRENDCERGSDGERDTAFEEPDVSTSSTFYSLPTSFISHLQRTQITGKFSEQLLRGCWNRDVKRLNEVAAVDCFAGTRNEAIVDVKFDALGELFLICKLTGELGVMNFEEYNNAAKRGRQWWGTIANSSVDPILTIYGQYLLQAARWHPTNQNVVATISKCSRQVPIYNLETYRGQPKLVLEASNGSSASIGSVSAGFNDMQFLSRRTSTIMAADRGGRVFIWDLRCGRHPNISLVSEHQRSGGGWRKVVFSLCEGPDGENFVAGGTNTGEILKWDIRKAGQTLMPPTGETVIRGPREPQVLVGDCLQEAVVRWCVHSMVPYPRDPRLLAFIAVSSKRQWVGGLDLHSGEITHLCKGEEAPLDYTPDENMKKCQQKAAWLSSSQTLVTGNCFRSSLSAIDFSTSKIHDSHDDYDGHGTGAYNPRYEAHIPTTRQISCVSCHPSEDTIIAGTTHNEAVLVQRDICSHSRT
ncbi:hypothetical protein BSKO_01318 [Bryopsis sp. KO-2023]|nr:hypothetical protein BSKO_01318 [Bryopsis sp. KO-2023]